MAFVPCAAITSGLNGQSCTTNPGGVTEIILTNFEDIASIGLTGATSQADPNGSLVSQILGPGGTGATVGFFYQYTFRRNTASFNEDLTKDLATGSLFYTQTGTIILDKIDRTKRDELMLLDNSLIVVIAKHSNGSYWIYGAQDGMYVTANASTTGTNKTDQNGYTITLVAEEAVRAYEVSPTVSGGGSLVGIDDLIAP